MNLLTYIFRRILVAIPVLWLITLFGFILTYLIPSDPLAMVLSERAAANPEIVRAYRQRWGLDAPPLQRYLIYVSRLVQGDLGESIATQQPVREDLARFFPATVELALAATIVAITLGIPLGILAAVYHERWVDHVGRFVSLLGVSVPVFWLGLLALSFLYYRLQILPGPGRLSPRIEAPPAQTGFLLLDCLLSGRYDALADAARHLILPSLVLGAYSMGLITRIMRSSMLEVLRQDYVRTARAKGLSQWGVVMRHAFRNAALPVLTATGLAFGNLMAGAVMTETIFAWPGIGRYAVESAAKVDFAPLMGVTLAVALIYIVINLAVDVLYAVFDPRIRLG